MHLHSGKQLSGKNPSAPALGGIWLQVVEGSSLPEGMLCCILPKQYV